jgi:hypothetical protein
MFAFLSLKIFGCVMLSGVLSTLLLPETCGRSLEELSNEHQKGFIRGAFALSYAKYHLADTRIELSC